MTKKLPLFYFSPTVCWVDDSQLFLDAASHFVKQDYHCLTFTDAKKAVEFLSTTESLFTNINFTRELTESDIFDVQNHFPIDINISEVTQLSNNPPINEEMGVLVIDYNMPYMSGLEICRALKDHPYKKILLTGDIAQAEVIDAFNQGIINKYIAKDSPNVAEKLKNAILELSYQYFYDSTKNLLSHLETARLSPLSDPIFADFFFKWREANELKEFYLINRQGSFLLKNKLGEDIYFIVMSEHAITEFLKLNTETPKQIQPILSKTSHGELLPFFGIAKESWEFDYTDWNKYFYPAQMMQGREKYYWTTIKNEAQ